MQEGNTYLFETDNLKEAEKRHQLLYQIVANSGRNTSHQLQKALKLTTELLDMDLGIISHIDNGVYTILHQYSTNGETSDKKKLDVKQTYCSIALEKNDLVAISHMGESAWSEHPCYELFELEAYLGIPVYVDGEVYGTLNFSSATPKEEKFAADDKKLIQILGNWAGEIIKKKKVKQELEKQKELYRLISTNSADMVCLHALDGSYQFVSPSAKTILGYDPDELIGLNPYELFHPEDQKRIQTESHQKALENDSLSSFQYRIRKKNGEYIWFDTATQPIMDEAGEIVNLQTTSRDITKRKKLELLFSEAQEIAHIGGWEYDLETEDLTWTDEVYRIHELPIGTPLKIEDGLSYYPQKTRELLDTLLTRAIEHGTPWDEELPFITAKNNFLWVRANGKAEFKQGKAYKLVGTFQDITQQKESEEKIEAQNKRLQTLTETQDKLYSIIAHDLKGAFFGITGMLNLIKDDLQDYSDLDPMILRQIGLVENSAGNAHQLFENLLEWTRIQSDGMNVNASTFDLISEMEKTIGLLQSTAENKKISLNTDFVSKLMVKCDQTMISTIFRNLLSNALKFSKEKSEIDISISNTDTQAHISIKDYGIGMPESVKNTLFDPSSRPKRAGTKNEKGTGLGLLLTKEMIELNNGTIQVESEDGVGTEFLITLPIYSTP
jgi:PAS domain S-box-containing protein